MSDLRMSMQMNSYEEDESLFPTKSETELQFLPCKKLESTYEEDESLCEDETKTFEDLKKEKIEELDNKILDDSIKESFGFVQEYFKKSQMIVLSALADCKSIDELANILIEVDPEYRIKHKTVQDIQHIILQESIRESFDFIEDFFKKTQNTILLAVSKCKNTKELSSVLLDIDSGFKINQ